MPEKYFTKETARTRLHANRAINNPISLLDDVPHKPEDALMSCYRILSTPVNRYRMSDERRSSFAEALTRFSMTSKDSDDESEEVRSEGLHAYEAEPPS